MRQAYGRSPQHWTKSHWDRLEALLNDGWNDNELAYHFGTSQWSIMRARRRRGWEPGPQHAGFWTASEVNVLMGMSEKAIRIRVWIRKGWMKGIIRYRPQIKNPVILVKHTWLYDFIEDPAHFHRWRWEDIVDPAMREFARKARFSNVVSIKEAAKEIGVEASTVKTWVYRYGLPVLNCGARRGMYMRQRDVDFIKERYQFGDGLAEIAPMIKTIAGSH